MPKYSAKKKTAIVEVRWLLPDREFVSMVHCSFLYPPPNEVQLDAPSVDTEPPAPVDPAPLADHEDNAMDVEQDDDERAAPESPTEVRSALSPTPAASVIPSLPKDLFADSRARGVSSLAAPSSPVF